MIEIDTQHKVYSVVFAGDDKQVLIGGKEGVRRWRIEDGVEAGEPIQVDGAEVYAMALSPDQKWLVCGFKAASKDAAANIRAYVSVWDARSLKKVLDITEGHTNSVFSVDVCPDSTKFATGGSTPPVMFIWSITTGKRLVGPLLHDDDSNGWGVVAVRFSPNGNRIATITAGKRKKTQSICIYDSENGHQLLDIPFQPFPAVSSPLTWSADGSHLFAISCNNEVHYFDSASGSLLSKWSAPGDGTFASVVLSHNQLFIVVSSLKSQSLWSTSTYLQMGTVIEHASYVRSVALSPDDNYIVTGEENGKVTAQHLSEILSPSHFALDFSLISASSKAFKPWMRGNLAGAEELLTQDIGHPSDAIHYADLLAHRALLRTRLKHWSMAIDDAKKSVKIRRSVIGVVAHAIALVGNGEQESAMDEFDLVFSAGLSSENNFLLLIKAIILFECKKYDSAISRASRLLDLVVDKSPYIAVLARMHWFLGTVSMKAGDNERAIKLFTYAKSAIPIQKGRHLVAISLIFGWDFDRLATEIQSHLFAAIRTVVETLGGEEISRHMTADLDPDFIRKCITTFEKNGDEAFRSDDHKRAITQFSAALSLNPSKPVGLLVKRSAARGLLGLWKDALQDANEAIKMDPSNAWGHERRYAAQRGLSPDDSDEAMDAFICMLSLIEGSANHELANKLIMTPQLETVINDAVQGVFRGSPLVLIDVRTGCLCDRQKRLRIFKSDPHCKELIFSMMGKLDMERIQQVVEKYFRYVTLSHVWQGEEEPSFQDVQRAGSVKELDASPLNAKLRRFCEEVRTDGYYWAWSDTCCIDKTTSTVLNQSLKMMYKWYEASTATFVLLSDVASEPLALGGLRRSKWMTRAWTSQELLASKVIRFYAGDWKPYLRDTRSNHKESPEIMQELADAIGIACENIIAFNPDDLGVREKLRMASTRYATEEEDIAYSLIGIFKSDIIPHYGERDAALGHLLEEIVARSGEVTVLDWTGEPSPYNSCLPATLAVYNQPPSSPPAIDEADIDSRVALLRNSLSETDAKLMHEQITRLTPARFANRRLRLPCIIFTVETLDRNEPENRYFATVTGIGDVKFQTSDRLPLAEPRKLIFTHPWIRDLRDPLNGFIWPSHASPDGTMDDYTRALRMVIRLQQPFHALLLQQQPNGEFKRVASDREIVVQVQESIDFVKYVHASVVEIL